MQKKYFSISIFLYSIIFFSICSVSFADIEAEFKQAEEYKKMGNYQQAEAVFQSIITNNPGTKDSLRAQRQIIYSLLGRNADAQAAINGLLTDFAEQEGWLSALYDIAGRCEERKKYDYAKGIYQKITQKYTAGSAQFNNAQANIAKVNILPLIDSNNITEARADVNGLITSFAGNAALPDVLYDIGGKYHSAGKFEQAKELYQRIVADYPDTKYSLRAQRALARVYIATGKTDEAKTAVEKVASDFSDDSQTYQSLLDLARNYTSRGQYEQAKDVYRQIAQKWPNSTFANKALFESAKADVYTLLDNRDEPNALSAIDSFIANFASDSNLPSALLDFGQRTDSKNSFEPNEFTRILYNKLVEQFPQSPQSQLAELNNAKMNLLTIIDNNADVNVVSLIDNIIEDFNDRQDLAQMLYKAGAYYFDKKKYENAIKFWEPILRKFSEKTFTDRDEVPYLLAFCYEYIGDYPTAIQYYTMVIDLHRNSQYAYRVPYTIGLLCRNRKEYEKAIYWFSKQEELFSDKQYNEMTLFYRGTIYLCNLNDFVTAKKIFQQYVDKYPNGQFFTIAFYDLAVCNEKLSPSAEATKLRETADYILKSKSVTIKFIAEPNELKEGEH